MHEAHLDGGDLIVAYPRDRIVRAPWVSEGADLSIAEEDLLFDYYAVPIDGVLPSVARLGTSLHLVNTSPPSPPQHPHPDLG